MYPGMARVAREEGFEDVAEWFEVCIYLFLPPLSLSTMGNIEIFTPRNGTQTLARAEKSHAGRFEKALRQLEAGEMD